MGGEFVTTHFRGAYLFFSFLQKPPVVYKHVVWCSRKQDPTEGMFLKRTKLIFHQMRTWKFWGTTVWRHSKTLGSISVCVVFKKRLVWFLFSVTISLCACIELWFDVSCNTATQFADFLAQLLKKKTQKKPIKQTKKMWTFFVSGRSGFQIQTSSVLCFLMDVWWKKTKGTETYSTPSNH